MWPGAPETLRWQYPLLRIWQSVNVVYDGWLV